MRKLVLTPPTAKDDFEMIVSAFSNSESGLTGIEALTKGARVLGILKSVAIEYETPTNFGTIRTAMRLKNPDVECELHFEEGDYEWLKGLLESAKWTNLSSEKALHAINTYKSATTFKPVEAVEPA